MTANFKVKIGVLNLFFSFAASFTASLNPILAIFSLISYIILAFLVAALTGWLAPALVAKTNAFRSKKRRAVTYVGAGALIAGSFVLGTGIFAHGAYLPYLAQQIAIFVLTALYPILFIRLCLKGVAQFKTEPQAIDVETSSKSSTKPNHFGSERVFSLAFKVGAITALLSAIGIWTVANAFTQMLFLVVMVVEVAFIVGWIATVLMAKLASWVLNRANLQANSAEKTLVSTVFLISGILFIFTSGPMIAFQKGQAISIGVAVALTLSEALACSWLAKRFLLKNSPL